MLKRRDFVRLAPILIVRGTNRAAVGAYVTKYFSLAIIIRYSKCGVLSASYAMSKSKDLNM